MCQGIFFLIFQTILKDTNNWVRPFWKWNTHFHFEQHYILEVISLLSIGLFLDQDPLSSNEELRKFSLMLCMVLLKASQRHNSDLDCAAGWEKFRDFTPISDENSGHFPLSCVTLHPLSLLAALLQKGHGAGMVEGIPARNSSAPGSIAELSVFCPHSEASWNTRNQRSPWHKPNVFAALTATVQRSNTIKAGTESFF